MATFSIVQLLGMVGKRTRIRRGDDRFSLLKLVNKFKTPQPAGYLIGVLPVTPTLSFQKIVVTVSQRRIIQMEKSIGRGGVPLVGLAELSHLIGAFKPIRLSLCFSQSGQKHTSEYTNDGNDH